MKKTKEPKRIKLSEKLLLDSIYNGLVSIDNEGLIVYFNKRAEEIFQIPFEAAKGKYILEILPNTGGKLLKCMESERSFINYKIKGKRISIIANITPIVANRDVIGCISVFQEVSEVEKITQELDAYKKLSRQLDAIFKSSFDGLFITDGKGRVLSLNETSRKFIGHRREDIIGQTVQDLLALGYIENAVTPNVIKGRALLTKLQRLKNGKQIIITGNPVFDDEGNIEFVVVNERDITMLNKMKNQLMESKELTEKYFSELQKIKATQYGKDKIVAVDDKTKKLLETALVAAEFDSTVIITGESGVGKGMIARFIHDNSHRANGPFIKINCGAIPDTLIESELFGYKKGAFTGADAGGKIGLIEVADKGTCLLDEIGEISQSLQVKLLSVLENKEITPVGGTKKKRLDVRFIAATNKELDKMVLDHKFREDLFYRLNIIPIRIPPLRERRDDIPSLIHKCLVKLNKKFGSNKIISQEVAEILTSYSFPGNIRELENLIERLIVLCPDDEIKAHHLPQRTISRALDKEPYNYIKKGLSLPEAVEKFEEQIIKIALKRHGTKSKAAKALGVDPSTIVRKTKKYLISPGDAVLH